MEVVKETNDYKIIKKRSGRYGVKDENGQWINGIEKIKILVNEGLIKTAIPTVEAPVVEEKPEEEKEKEGSKESDEDKEKAEKEGDEAKEDSEK